MSYRCPKCFRTEQCCLCSYTKQFDPEVKFVLLMHPKESKKQRTGTGRLCKISMKDCEIIEGIDFSQNERLQNLLNDSQYFPVLMYPGPDAMNAKSEQLKLQMKSNPKKKILAILIDGTWFCARQIINKNKYLLNLNKMSFSKNYTSIFTFKKEPHPECLSTLETCYYFIQELKENDFINKNINPEPLMNVFKQMIKFQLQAENERVSGLRPNVHAGNFRYTKLKEIPDFKIEKY